MASTTIDVRSILLGCSDRARSATGSWGAIGDPVRRGDAPGPAGHAALRDQRHQRPNRLAVRFSKPYIGDWQVGRYPNPGPSSPPRWPLRRPSAGALAGAPGVRRRRFLARPGPAAAPLPRGPGSPTAASTTTWDRDGVKRCRRSW
jgi:hypothetical protein